MSLAKRLRRENNCIDDTSNVVIEELVVATTAVATAPTRKRPLSPDSESDLIKRFRSAEISVDETPYLTIREIETVPLVKRRSQESIYLSFSMWDVDYRQWAASDIQRIYKGYVARKHYRLHYVTK